MPLIEYIVDETKYYVSNRKPKNVDNETGRTLCLQMAHCTGIEFCHF